MQGQGQLPGPCLGHPDRFPHRLRRSRHQPSPHTYQNPGFNTAFVPMSLFFNLSRTLFQGGMQGQGQLPGPCSGHPHRRWHRLRRSRHQPSPHTYQNLCFNTAFVPMSFIFRLIQDPVSGRDPGPSAAPSTLRRASRPTQAPSETVQAPAKPTRIPEPLFQYSVCIFPN